MRTLPTKKGEKWKENTYKSGIDRVAWTRYPLPIHVYDTIAYNYTILGYVAEKHNDTGVSYADMPCLSYSLSGSVKGQWLCNLVSS